MSKISETFKKEYQKTLGTFCSAHHIENCSYCGVIAVNPVDEETGYTEYGNLYIIVDELNKLRIICKKQVFVTNVLKHTKNNLDILDKNNIKYHFAQKRRGEYIHL